MIILMRCPHLMSNCILNIITPQNVLMLFIIQGNFWLIIIFLKWRLFNNIFI